MELKERRLLNTKRKLIIGVGILFVISLCTCMYTIISVNSKKENDVVSVVNSYFPGQGEIIYSALHHEIAEYVAHNKLAVNSWYIDSPEVDGNLIYVKATCNNNITLDVRFDFATEEVDIVEE